ncbi:hypothetical protein NN561_009098 [Cricetulus griseus]
MHPPRGCALSSPACPGPAAARAASGPRGARSRSRGARALGARGRGLSDRVRSDPRPARGSAPPAARQLPGRVPGSPGVVSREAWVSRERTGAAAGRRSWSRGHPSSRPIREDSEGWRTVNSVPSVFEGVFPQTGREKRGERATRGFLRPLRGHSRHLAGLQALCRAQAVECCCWARASERQRCRLASVRPNAPGAAAGPREPRPQA